MVFPNVSSFLNAQSTANTLNDAPRTAGCDQLLLGTNVNAQLIDGTVRSSHLSQFLIKKNMRIAPLLRSCLIEANKMKLDNILKCSIWEEMEGTYLNLLKSKEYVPSSSGHTWPVKDIGKSLDTNDCDNECESQENDEDDAEELDDNDDPEWGPKNEDMSGIHNFFSIIQNIFQI